MAHLHQRTHSTSEGLKLPHSVSLKVLRLSKPSLVYQHPLPRPEDATRSPIPLNAGHSYPSNRDENFIISPVLQLPEAFGSAYVGETFSCTLCANNELEEGDGTKTVSGVKINAEMQTPSVPTGIALDLTSSSTDRDSGSKMELGESVQSILRFELREEGSHTLVVQVAYTETQMAGEGQPTSGRVRTFRKLYQFVAQQMISVRTKAAAVQSLGGTPRYALEAQLENLGDSVLSLESVKVNPKPEFTATSLNWDCSAPFPEPVHRPVLNPQDIMQVAFLLEQQRDRGEVDEQSPQKRVAGDSKVTLGQLAIQWRTALGDRGSLSTGWLASRQ